MANVLEVLSVIFLFGVLIYGLYKHFEAMNKMSQKYYSLKDEALTLEYKNKELEHNNKIYMQRNKRLASELETQISGKLKAENRLRELEARVMVLTVVKEPVNKGFVELDEAEFDELKREMFEKGWTACQEEMNKQPIEVSIDLGPFAEHLLKNKNGKGKK